MKPVIKKSELSAVESRMKTFGLTPEQIQKESAFALNIVNSNEKLSECSRESIFSSIVQAANLGLTLNPSRSECALIPRKGICTIMPMYQGLANLAYKSGNILQLITHEVRANDDYEINATDKENPIKHSFGFGDRGKPIGYYTLIRFKGGGVQLETMSLDEVLKIRDSSDGYFFAKKYGKEKDHPWFKWFSEMARKACLKRALKYVNTTDCNLLHEAVNLDNQDYTANNWQLRKIERLLVTATIDDDEKEQIENSLNLMTEKEADELIQRLEMNQLPNHPGYNDRTSKKEIAAQVLAQVENEKA